MRKHPVSTKFNVGLKGNDTVLVCYYGGVKRTHTFDDDPEWLKILTNGMVSRIITAVLKVT
ncbi:uncharacterized protein SETTUDRAFT_22627 [Exserohilum turcica Et28A]|uniref:Uncharacterized protein n=1 Tax=Exserohilum turcicum (strain 28A) TaxID=671987 RepID=R0JN95_EXST2|nr:uncharacterized protein SETTUDRAFT_22627 [Exserohilum turcica Et28A]EOA82648.1 hypothetical protein SETTUDRAFT_22627 [Exserohilum turcica Et28A]